MTEDEERASERAMREVELREVSTRVMDALTAAGWPDVEWSDEDGCVHAYDETTEHTISVVVEFG